MTLTTGECFCGNIQYEISGPLKPARSCHCSRCRKAFSGAGSTMSFVEPGTFKWISGEENLTQYTNKQGVGIGFCKTCGSTLVALLNDEVFGYTLGPLNGNPDVDIAMHLFVESKADWDEIGGSAPQHAEYPPE